MSEFSSAEGNFKSGRAVDSHCAIFFVVPTGDVDSRTIRFPFFNFGANERTACSKYFKSGSFFPLKGVGTAMMKAEVTGAAVSKAARTGVVKAEATA